MPTTVLPTDARLRQGGWLFLTMLAVFFVSTLLFYVIYVVSRLGEPERLSKLPAGFLISTACLLVISGLVHAATRTVRRSRTIQTGLLLSFSAVAAVGFLAMQADCMWSMVNTAAYIAAPNRGVTGMVVVLAILHALHVLGGVIALGIVSVKSLLGRYDHERHWPVDFAAQYWHFLDVIWLLMLAAFVGTTGGF